MVRLLYLIILLVSISLPSFGQDSELLVKPEGFLVKVDKVREELLPLPQEVFQGDVVEYRITVENKSNKVLMNIVITAKVPDGTEYVEGSASDNPEFSKDGKVFSTDPVGAKKLRWKIPELKPGERVVLKYRVKVKI